MEILFEDENIIAFLKPYGLLMHEGDIADGRETFLGKLLTLRPEQAILQNQYQLRDRSINLAGIAHRLDRDTSGIVLVAKSDVSLLELKHAFTEGLIQKEYTALVHGSIKEPFTIDMALGREKKGFKRAPEGAENARGPYLSAKTDVVPLEQREDTTLVTLIPHTGRTHQLRAHLSFTSHPIVGDILYGTDADKKEKRLYLHASKVTLPNGKIIKNITNF